MEKLQSQGKIKSIGVSNFSIQDLETLMASTDIIPAVNQVEFHPLFNHPQLLAYCKEHHITVQAYAPLARGAYLNSPLMIEIGNRHKKTPAQIGLRWLLQQGILSFQNLYIKIVLKKIVRFSILRSQKKKWLLLLPWTFSNAWQEYLKIWFPTS